MRPSRRITGLSGIVLAALVVTVFFGMYSYAKGGESQAARFLQQEFATDTLTPGPCDYLADQFRGTDYNLGHYVDYDLSDYVTMSNVVAKARIAQIESARFETASGSPPPPPTATSTAATPTPSGTEEVDESDVYFFPEDRVLRPLVLDASDIYSGTEATGYVVAEWGGEVSGCSGYTYETNVNFVTGDVDDTGMVFLNNPPSDWVSDPPNWFAHLERVADELSVGEDVYRPMLVANWYLYDKQAETATTVLPSEDYPPVPMKRETALPRKLL